MLGYLAVAFICTAIGFILGTIFAVPEAPPFPVHEAPDVTGPRLPHHRQAEPRTTLVALKGSAPAVVRPIRPRRVLPEWQEHQRDVDHLERVSHAARSEAWWTKTVD